MACVSIRTFGVFVMRIARFAFRRRFDIFVVFGIALVVIVLLFLLLRVRLVGGWRLKACSSHVILRSPSARGTLLAQQSLLGRLVERASAVPTR